MKLNSSKKKTTKENGIQSSKRDEDPSLCFLCLEEAGSRCSLCQIPYCSPQHLALHRQGDYCFPYRCGRLPDKGRVLFATRDISAMELVLVDPGTVVGPNYTSQAVCLECLKEVEVYQRAVNCPVCGFPLCGEGCVGGPRHARECRFLATKINKPPTLQTNIAHREKSSIAYAVVTPLRVLLTMKEGGDNWVRTNQLMDHLEDKDEEDWQWYQDNVVNIITQELGLGEFTETDVARAIGLLNVNAVCLKFPTHLRDRNTEVGKGIYPIFAIMSHHCVCNARYVVDPSSTAMYVRARLNISRGEELTVQYLSALYGNMKRRKKIKKDWYFDCQCKRCSDVTECGSLISSVKCLECAKGNLLPSVALNYDAAWKCSHCTFTIDNAKVETLVDGIEEKLEAIKESGEFVKYRDFIDKYSGRILHANHYLVTTARRNLIQFLSYRGSPSENLSMEELREKFQLCQDFYSVLKKIDPGFSEISMFARRELHFSRLFLLQKEHVAGLISQEEFSVKSRSSLDMLEKIEKEKDIISFKIK